MNLLVMIDKVLVIELDKGVIKLYQSTVMAVIVMKKERKMTI